MSGETSLAPMVDGTISVITNDGRHVVGTLRGFDQATNLIVDDCHERVYSSQAGVEQVPLAGLQIIRGDNIAIVGELDVAADSGVDLGSVRAPPLRPVTH